MSDSIQIVHEKDHYAIYIDGKFYCSADDMHEAVKELEAYQANEDD